MGLPLRGRRILFIGSLKMMLQEKIRNDDF